MENVDWRHLTTGSSGLTGQARSQLNRMFGQRKMTTDRTTRLVGVALIVAAVVGFFFASPEPTEIVPLPDGMATVIPRIPWGAIATEVAFVIGLGCVIASVVIRARMRT